MQIRDLPSTSTVESTDYLVKEQSDGTTQKIAVGDFVVNDLTSTATDKPGSANMLNTLNDKITNLIASENAVLGNITISADGYLDITSLMPSTPPNMRPFVAAINNFNGAQPGALTFVFTQASTWVWGVPNATYKGVGITVYYITVSS